MLLTRRGRKADHGERLDGDALLGFDVAEGAHDDGAEHGAPDGEVQILEPLLVPADLDKDRHHMRHNGHQLKLVRDGVGLLQ